LRLVATFYVESCMALCDGGRRTLGQDHVYSRTECQYIWEIACTQKLLNWSTGQGDTFDVKWRTIGGRAFDNRYLFEIGEAKWYLF